MQFHFRQPSPGEWDMTDEMWFELSSEGQAIWNQNAAFWDEYMGEGNDFQRVLIGPATERLLRIEEDELVLDVACGNGNFARRMAEKGARVVAFDFSSTFIERARRRTRDTRFSGRIEYLVMDATNYEELMSLGLQRFDAAVCTMALMDMAAIEPLFNALSRLLKPGGRFVFSVMHPCFNSGGIHKLAEQEDREGELVTTYAIKVTSYATPSATKGLGVVGQPVPQYYFHRPLSVLLQHCFNAGFVLDGIEEPAFKGEVAPNRPFSWANFADIPPALVARVRLI
jgi:2-polyprenyl-3-methyl-5-hydroxy-6-metoxy-1,4-benzoquinol methylase